MLKCIRGMFRDPKHIFWSHLRWTELLSSRRPHKSLSSPTLNWTNRGRSFVIVIAVIIRVAIVVVIIVIVAVIIVVCLWCITELLPHTLASWHTEGLSLATCWDGVVLFIIRVDLVTIGGIVVREPALDVGLQKTERQAVGGLDIHCVVVFRRAMSAYVRRTKQILDKIEDGLDADSQP